jgi:TRAP-type mannitol/chloroaromatic compound transport system substrate-binding protein
LGLEKTRQTKKAINELYDKNGKSTTNQNEIMEIEVDYYKKLYKSTNPDNDKLKKYIENTKVHNKLFVLFFRAPRKKLYIVLLLRSILRVPIKCETK